MARMVNVSYPSLSSTKVVRRKDTKISVFYPKSSINVTICSVYNFRHNPNLKLCLVVEKDPRFFNDMEVVSDQATSICTHCDRDIPAANIDLHYVHCSRNLEKCKVCGDMVPKQHAEDHYLSTHAPVACSLCSEIMERDILDTHTGENCPLRMVTCEFCEFPLPAVDLAEHQEVCGNRTELCHLCNKYVRLREQYNHEFNCKSIQDNAAGSSRDARPAERDEGARRRRQQNEFSKKRLLFTIAVTGVAVLLGSIFYQRKPEPSNVH